MTVSLGTVVATSPANSSLASAIATTTAVVPKTKVLIIWQKSKISPACRKALATINAGVHIWDPVIDGQKLDAQAFVNASYDCLILWAGNPNVKTSAADVHTWVSNNRAFIKTSDITSYVIPTKIFSLAGIKSVYEDFAVAIKALPKHAADLGALLVKLEAKFPESEVSLLKGLVEKALSFFTKNGTAS